MDFTGLSTHEIMQITGGDCTYSRPECIGSLEAESQWYADMNNNYAADSTLDDFTGIKVTAWTL